MKNYNPHTVGEAIKAGTMGYALALITVVVLTLWGHDTGRLATLASNYLNWAPCTTRNTRVIN